MTADNQKRLSQWLTQPWVAEAMWARAKTHTPKYVLEPSAGDGALILPMDADVHVTAFELDRARFEPTLSCMDPPIEVFYQDFLTAQWDLPETGYLFDVADMNPPFEGGLDVAFVLEAFRLCAVVIALVRVPFLHRKGVWEELWSRPDVCLSWRGDVIPRPRFGGKFNPQDEYVVVEIVHGPQTDMIGYSRIINPKLLTGGT
jgi:predicted RNA methylase